MHIKISPEGNTIIIKKITVKIQTFFFLPVKPNEKKII